MTGEQLRAVRKRLGLTQRQFAKQLGLVGNSLARLERDERKISKTLEILVRLIAKQPPPRGKR